MRQRGSYEQQQQQQPWRERERERDRESASGSRFSGQRERWASEDADNEDDEADTTTTMRYRRFQQQQQPAVNGSRIQETPVSRRASHDYDRRTSRGGPPLPNGPPGSNWQSSSQSSVNGNAEAGPSWSASSSSFRGSPPRYNGQRAAPYSQQQRGPRRPPRWKQDAYEEGEMPREDAYEAYDDTERPRRSISPPPRRAFSASRDRSPVEDGFRFSDRIAPRGDRDDDDRPSRRPRDIDAWRSRDVDEPKDGYRSPVWSDNRRYPRPAPRWEPPPTVIGKRSRYNADQYDRPQDNGWSSRPARSHSVTSNRTEDGVRQPRYAEESRVESRRAPIKLEEDSIDIERGDRSPGQISSSTAQSPPRRSESPHRTESYHSPVSSFESSEARAKAEPEQDSTMDRSLLDRISGGAWPATQPAPLKEGPLLPESPRMRKGPNSNRTTNANPSPSFPPPSQPSSKSETPQAQRSRRSSATPPPRSLSDPHSDHHSPMRLKDRLGPPPSQSPAGQAGPNGISLTPPTRPRAMSQQVQNSTPPGPRSHGLPQSLQKSIPPSPITAPASAPRSAATVFDSSRQAAENQLRSPSPIRTETSDSSSRASNSRHDAPAGDKLALSTDLSPKLENERPLLNGAHLRQATQTSKPVTAPRPALETRDSQFGSLRAPLPLRMQVQDPAPASADKPSSTVDGQTTKENAIAAEIEVKTAGIVDISAETVEVDTSIHVEPVRPSSPLSDLPHSQPAPEQTEEEAAATTKEDSPAADVGEESDFEKTLQSIIEHENSSDIDLADVTDLEEDSQFREPKELPLHIQPREDAADAFAYPEEMLAQHTVLEPFLLEEMAKQDERRGMKIFRLREEYKELDQEWKVHCSRLEKIRDRQKRRQQAAAPPLTPAIDASGLPFVAAPATPSILAPSGRTNRRNAAASLGYGDAVRSEAEFLEILARLEDADMADPNLRAMRTTATVPDMAIDESEKELLVSHTFDDENGLVKDPFEHYGLNKAPDNWTEEEIAIFCRRYATHPKQFGKIAASLPNKTTPQCVLFYYRSKKKIDFRALVDKRSRDGKRKKSKKGEVEEEAPGAKKGPSLLGNLKRSRVQEDDDDEEDEEPQTPGSAIARESAVLSTAKALTRQLHGVTSDDAAAHLMSDLRGPTGPPTRMPVSRQQSANKKAARFLSPPPPSDTALDSVMPASDGAIAAAEVLGVLAGALEPSIYAPRLPTAAAKQKKRKPSVSEPLVDGHSGDEGTPRPSGSNKRARGPTSSYWSVADKNEFLRLLGVHGKNWSAIASGIESKTAVQCKNFFQNNTKKMNLADIAAQAEEENGASTGASGVVIEELEMPSVFAEAQAEHGPASGYFDSLHRGKQPAKTASFSGGGGMHLRNLLDDAPDAEGGAVHHEDYLTPPILPDVNEMPGGDSSTEDEADPARYATTAATVKQNGQHHRRVVSHGSVRPESANAPHIQHLPQRRETRPDGLYGSHRDSSAAAYYGHPIYADPRHSPEFGTRDLVSPIYSSALHAERAYLAGHQGLPPPSSRFAGAPGGRQWSPYESRTIYNSQPPTASLHSPYYRPSERRNSEDLTHIGRPSPPLHPSAYFRRSHGEPAKGLPPPAPLSASTYARSTVYEAPQRAYYAHPHHQQAPMQHHPSLRMSEGPDPGSPYYSAGSYSHLARSR